MRIQSATASLVLVVATSLLANSVGTAQGDAGGYKLSGPQIGTSNTGDVTAASLSPDGSRVVYYADRDRDDVFELYSAPIGGGPSAKVNQELDSGWSIFDGNFWITPDSSRVLYLAQAPGSTRLLASPLQGLPRGAVATLLGAPFSFLNDIEAPIVAGGRAVFIAQQIVSPSGLFSAPLDGGSAVRLSSVGSVTTSFAASADGAWVVYRANQDTQANFELYAVPTDGSAAAVKLNGPLVGSADIQSFLISPASTHVAYVANQEGVNELFGAPIDGSSAAVKLNGPLTSSSVHTDFIVGSDGRVYYESVEAGVLAVRSVPITGGTPLQITPGTASFHQLSPDAGFIVYKTSSAVLSSVATDGRQVVAQLADFGPAGQVIDGFQFGPDGARVVFRGRATTGDEIGVFSAPVDGSQSAAALHQSPLANHVEADFEVASDGARVAWITKSAAGVSLLYSAPIDGSALEVELNDPFPTSGTTGILQFDITSDGSKVVYRANQAMANVTEVFGVAIDKTTPVHVVSDSLDPVGAGEVLTDFLITADARAVLYRSDQTQDDVFALYTTPVDGSELPQEIHPEVDLFVIHPDDQRVFFTAAGGIYVAPVDASSPASLLFASATPSQLGITADGSRVVYSQSVSRNLFSGPSDGSTGAVQLNTTNLDTLNGGKDFFLSPDSSFALYLGKRPVGSLFDLFVVDVDGSAAPIALTSSIALGASDSDGDPRISADSEFVLFRLDKLSGRQELFSVPSDGSSAPVALNPAPPSTDYDVEVDWRLHPDGVHVFFRFGTNPKDLYRARVDGTGLPLLIDDVAHEVADFLLTPDGTQVVFSTTTPNQIRAGSSSGGTSLVLTTGTTSLKAVSSDGNHVLYTSGLNLHTVPIDGSSPKITVSHSNAPGESVASVVTTTPKRVLFRADQTIEGQTDLFSAPYGYAQLGSPIAVGRHPAATVGVPKVTPDGSLAVFVHDRFVENAFELWAMPLGPRVRSLSPATGVASTPERVTIRGSGFTPDSIVSFDGVAAQSVTFVSAIELLVIPPVLPPPTSGKNVLRVDVCVSDGVSEHVFENGYAYLFVTTLPQ